MPILMDENPTRKKIILLLKKSEHMTVSELSGNMGITPMAVRQHIMSLEKRGIVKYTTRKSGVGRPVFLYRLTDKAGDIFPKSYSTFMRDMLRIIEQVDGRKKLDKLFQLRKDLLLNEKRQAIGNGNDQNAMVVAFARVLDNDGYMVELSDNNDAFELKQFNCMLHGIASDFPEACKYELELYRELLGQNVERRECQRDGAPACIYVIPK